MLEDREILWYIRKLDLQGLRFLLSLGYNWLNDQRAVLDISIYGGSNEEKPVGAQILGAPPIYWPSQARSVSGKSDGMSESDGQ